MSQTDAVVIASSTQFHWVGSAASLRAGEPLGATVNGKAVAIFLVDGEFIATAGICPHATGPLHEGEVEGRVLTCPWHGWGFNLDTGECEEDPCMHLERYPVKIEGDDILVGL